MPIRCQCECNNDMQVQPSELNTTKFANGLVATTQRWAVWSGIDLYIVSQTIYQTLYYALL